MYKAIIRLKIPTIIIPISSNCPKTGIKSGIGSIGLITDTAEAAVVPQPTNSKIIFLSGLLGIDSNIINNAIKAKRPRKKTFKKPKNASILFNLIIFTIATALPQLNHHSLPSQEPHPLIIKFLQKHHTPNQPPNQ